MPDGGWRIDTLDARGGFAFASQRDRDYADITEYPDPPCMFIGAPDFRPEPVANYALALGAGRGAFQSGLFAQQAEVSFPTVNAVVEFVRRAYLRGGGGDGADGGGGGGMPPLPIDGPVLPLSPEIPGEDIDTTKEGQRLRAAISKAIGTFKKDAARLELGQKKDFSKWPAASSGLDGEGAASTALDGPAMLASAALRLIYDMARRLPPVRDSVAVARWLREARMLGNLLASLDLWPLLWSDPYRRVLERLGERLQKALPGFKKLHDFSVRGCRLAFFITFFAGPPPDDDKRSRQFLHNVWYHIDRYDLWLNWTERDDSDPIYNLSRIPLPNEFEELFAKDLKGRVSLYHALTAFIGTPAEFDSVQPIIELVLFAAACIVGPDSGQPLSSWPNSVWSLERTPEISEVLRTAVRANADSAWRWLREHLPVMVFPQVLETAIASTAGLRYETVSPTLALSA